MSAGWIAVADALPDDATTVMVHTPVSNEPVWLGYYESEFRHWRFVEGAHARGVTHWAELPDPPKA